MMVGTTADLIFAWAAVGPDHIWGGAAVIALFFTVFFVAELKGRSLEEMDELLSKFRWGWQYSSFQTIGVGAQMAQVEMAIVDGINDDTKLNDDSDNKDDMFVAVSRSYL
ncbi:uncharacterized protein L199_005646 [Kwoniella botswanensis]|uniref:uncharacterized protein n=1 Tax=Kwoniella botswanensis TaxID=1268659 RepID=UPI00315D6438